MFGILNYDIMDPCELEGIETLQIDHNNKIYLFVDIPHKYAYTIIERFGEVDIVTVGLKEEKKVLLFSSELRRYYAPSELDSYQDLKETKVFGKNLLFCLAKEIYLAEYKDYFKLVIDKIAPGSWVEIAGRERSQERFYIGKNGYDLSIVNSAQIFPNALYVPTQQNGDILLLQGTNSVAYVTINGSLLGSITSSSIKCMFADYEKCENNIDKKISGAEKYLERKLKCKKNELDEIINGINEITDSAKRTIIENTRKIPRILQSISIVEEDIKHTRELLEDGINKAKQLPDITDVFMSEMILIAKTKKLHAVTPMPNGDHRDVYYGKFTIIINMESAIVYAINEEFNYAGKEHPHGFPDKRLCLGTINQDIAMLAANYDIPNMLGIMIDFLRSANRADCEGAKVQSWPFIDDKTGKININKASIYGDCLSLEEK